MSFNLINVGIGDFKITSAPDILRTILGSCVGICLYDPKLKIGGLSHIMLPNAPSNSVSIFKYAESAIPAMIDNMQKEGADKKRMIAKIAGGAKMFNTKENSIMGEIGNNNINKVKELLKESNIKVVAEDTGGDYGRTLDFYLESGTIKIKVMGAVERTL